MYATELNNFKEKIEAISTFVKLANDEWEVWIDDLEWDWGIYLEFEGFNSFQVKLKSNEHSIYIQIWFNGFIPKEYFLESLRLFKKTFQNIKYTTEVQETSYYDGADISSNKIKFNIDKSDIAYEIVEHFFKTIYEETKQLRIKYP